MSPRVVRVIITRSMVNIAGSAAMYAALRYLPLADALAIAFVYPFIMLLMGWTLLKEQVGIRRLLACSVGFIGTLLIIQPSFAAVGLPALLPLLVAFLFASVVLLTRQIAKDYDPVSLQSVSGLTSGLILMVIWALAGGSDIPDLRFTVPTTDQMITLLMVGVLGTLAHLAMSYAVRFAPSATLAPMQYVELPVATVIGWAMFGELPNGMATAGILITIIAGLAVILFEHKAVKRIGLSLLAIRRQLSYRLATRAISTGTWDHACDILKPLASKSAASEAPTSPSAWPATVHLSCFFMVFLRRM